VVRDLPRELRLGEPALKKRHKVKAAGAEKPEREDRAVAVLLEPRDLVVEVLLARLVEDRARNIVQLHRSRQACRDEGVVEGPPIDVEVPQCDQVLAPRALSVRPIREPRGDLSELVGTLLLVVPPRSRAA